MDQECFGIADSEIPTHIYLPKGVLEPAERRMLYACAKTADISDGSQVVDLGAFCGASAYCHAAGLLDNQSGLSTRT